MIGLDTNILVRYLAQDDPVQSPKATALFEHRLSEDEPGFISLVAMAETVWALSRLYALTKQDIANALESILKADTLVVQNEQEVFSAMIALRTGKGSFADALIAALGSWAGCSFTFTFDTKAAKLKGFNLM